MKKKIKKSIKRKLNNKNEMVKAFVSSILVLHANSDE